jgi:light-regulated signal transduction histidine kinase (bacteriophytochrome)
MSQTNKTPKIEPILHIGFLLMVAYYCADAAMDAFFHKEGHFWQQFFHPSSFELSIRILGISFLATLTVCGYVYARKRRKSEQDLSRKASALKQANKDLEAFSYSLTHDLRVPLTQIATASQILPSLCQEDQSEDQRFVLDTISDSCEWMDKMITSMLTLGRVAHCKAEIVPVDLSAIARSFLDTPHSHKPNPAEKAIISSGLMVNTDEPLIRIVLENLLGNARKYSHKMVTPTIEFGGLTMEGKDVFFVRDNGKGFDMTDGDMLFSPFSRIHNDNDFPGDGVGLATVHRILERLGGRVWAESEPEKGATFFFTLPKVEPN